MRSTASFWGSCQECQGISVKECQLQALLGAAMLPHAGDTTATMATTLWDAWRRRAEGTGCPEAEAVSRAAIGHSWMAGGAAEGPAAPRRERGWWQRVSADLSSAGGRRAGSGGGWSCTGASSPQQRSAGKPGQGCPLPAPSHPSAGRVALGVPHRDGDVSAGQQDLLAVACSTTTPSETGTGQRTQAVRCAGGLAGGLKITRCECLEGLGPRPWPHTIGGNPPASSIVCLQTLASSVLPRGHGSGQHKEAAGCPGGLPGRWRGAGAAVQVAVPQLLVQAPPCAGVPGSLLVAVEQGGALRDRRPRVITMPLQQPLPHGHVLVMLLSLSGFSIPCEHCASCSWGWERGPCCSWCWPSLLQTCHSWEPRAGPA